ncbi:MAG TPA: DNA-binding protein, partial [Ruminococcus sp.]|nr:DNA-binding protein [Ruminococcus sp.]
MEKNIEVSLLFDFYGELLKPSGRQAIDLYYNDDLSLAEIAAQTGITRQGVRDSIKRCEQQLFDFEKKLGLFRQFQTLRQGLDEIAVIAQKIKTDSQ